MNARTKLIAGLVQIICGIGILMLSVLDGKVPLNDALGLASYTLLAVMGLMAIALRHKPGAGIENPRAKLIAGLFVTISGIVCAVGLILVNKVSLWNAALFISGSLLTVLGVWCIRFRNSKDEVRQ